MTFLAGTNIVQHGISMPQHVLYVMRIQEAVRFCCFSVFILCPDKAEMRYQIDILSSFKSHGLFLIFAFTISCPVNFVILRRPPIGGF